MKSEISQADIKSDSFATISTIWHNSTSFDIKTVPDDKDPYLSGCVWTILRCLAPSNTTSPQVLTLSLVPVTGRVI